MFKIITTLAISGTVLLAVGTIILVRLNYNQEVLAKIVSGILIGIATIFIAVYFPLQASKIEKVFTTSIVMDEQDHLPIFVILDNSSQKVNTRLSKISSLSRPASGTGSETKIIVQKPTNFDESVRFLQELLRYKLVCDLADIQRVSWSVSTSGIRTRANVNQPVKPSDLAKFPGGKVLQVFSSNQFSRGEMEIFRWKHGYLPLPEGTELSLEHIPSSEQTGVEKHKVILNKKNYFKIRFIIESIGGSPGALPEGLVVDPSISKRSQTYHFSITMRAGFDKITSASPKTVEYKKWAEWLFDGIKEVNSD